MKHTSVTLPFEARALIKRMAMTPDGRLLLTIDEDAGDQIDDFLKDIVEVFVKNNRK